MSKIRTIVGDATELIGAGPRILAHVCNDGGLWNAGFVLSLTARWPEPEDAYRDWYRDRSNNEFGLGQVQFVFVEPNLWVANMVAIRKSQVSREEPALCEEALGNCLDRVAQRANDPAASVHMPRIGAGLGQGNWGQIKSLILGTMRAYKLSVYIYQLPGPRRHH